MAGCSLFDFYVSDVCSVLFVFGCQYQCNRLPGKTRLQNDLLCVEWDVKPCTLTHSFNNNRHQEENAMLTSNHNPANLFLYYKFLPVNTTNVFHKISKYVWEE